MTIVLPHLRGGEDRLFTLSLLHLLLTKGCLWAINFLAFRTAYHLSKENDLRQRVAVFVAGCSCCLGQCRPPAGTYPAGLKKDIKTQRNPGIIYAAFVTWRALCTFVSFNPPDSHMGPVLLLVPHFSGMKTEEGMA